MCHAGIEELENIQSRSIIVPFVPIDDIHGSCVALNDHDGIGGTIGVTCIELADEDVRSHIHALCIEQWFAAIVGTKVHRRCAVISSHDATIKPNDHPSDGGRVFFYVSTRQVRRADGEGVVAASQILYSVP